MFVKAVTVSFTCLCPVYSNSRGIGSVSLKGLAAINNLAIFLNRCSLNASLKAFRYK